MISLNIKNINTNKELNSIILKPSEKLELWNRRFCHFNIDNIKKKKKKKIIKNKNSNKISNLF